MWALNDHSHVRAPHIYSNGWQHRTKLHAFAYYASSSSRWQYARRATSKRLFNWCHQKLIYSIEPYLASFAHLLTFHSIFIFYLQFCESALRLHSMQLSSSQYSLTCTVFRDDENLKWQTNGNDTNAWALGNLSRLTTCQANIHQTLHWILWLFSPNSIILLFLLSAWTIGT